MQRLIQIVGMVLVTSCAGAPTDKPQTSTTSPTSYSAADLYKTTSIGLARSPGLAFSTGDRFLLHASDTSGVFNAYGLQLTKSEATALTQSSTDTIFPVSYFPEDDRVLVRSDQGGNELNHLYVRALDGQLHDLTPGENLRAGFSGWAQASQHFYVTTNERDPRADDLYQYQTQGYARELLYKNTLNLTLSLVSPDGHWLVANKTLSNADSDLYLIDLSKSAAEPVLITEHTGDAQHRALAFDPSGGLIYGTDAHGQFNAAWRYDLGSASHAAYLKSDWDILSVDFSSSGRYRVWLRNEDARTAVQVDDLHNGQQVSLGNPPTGNVSGVQFSRDEKQLAFGLSSATAPQNLYLANLTDATFTRVTDAANSEVSETDLVKTEVVRFKSYDGLEIPGIMYRPQGATAANPVPALIWVHGGPGGQSRTSYNPALQHLANHGYAIYAVNNRGSSGYGKTFFHLDDLKHGEVDLDDVIAAKDYLAELPWVQGSRIGIIGGSYGGYMVAAALAFRPEAFRVGVDIFGVTNWVRTLKSIPAWWTAQRQGLYAELGDPATDEVRLRRISPLFHASNINKPMLVVQGANDPRVLQVESDEIVETLRNNGVPVEYLVFADEGHGFLKRTNRIDSAEAILGFLDRYL